MERNNSKKFGNDQRQGQNRGFNGQGGDRGQGGNFNGGGNFKGGREGGYNDRGFNGDRKNNYNPDFKNQRYNDGAPQQTRFNNEDGNGGKPMMGGNNRQPMQGGRQDGGYNQRPQDGRRNYNNPSGGGNYDNQRGGDRQGGYGGGAGRGGKPMGGNRPQGGFNKKPQNSGYSANPEDNEMQLMKFTTNQFRLQISKDAPTFYQYPITIHSDDADGKDTYDYSPFEVQKIVRRAQKKIDMMIGQFLHWGFNIWTNQRIDESLIVESIHMNRQIYLKIDHTGEHIVNPSDINNPNRNDSQSVSQFLNIIIKQAMSDTGLLQFGQRPRFFDSSSPLEVKELDMQIWSGFKTSAYRYQSGCALIIDNCCRFMSTKTVLSKIHEIYDQIQNKFDENPDLNGQDFTEEFQNICRKEFIN